MTNSADSSGPTVYVVDDDPDILQLFERMNDAGNWNLKTWQHGQRFLDDIDLHAQAVLVLDLKLPDISGLDVLQKIVDADSTMPVIFMSEAAAVSDAMAAVKKGILDFLEKPFEVSKMRALIERAVDEGIKKRQDSQELAGLRSSFDRLTPREREVMDEVVGGNPNKVIGTTLGISAKTVEVHRANVMSKMNAGSVAELVQMALRLRSS